MSLIGIILAGGQARRMSSQDKALLDIGGGVTLLDRLVSRLRPQCGTLILSANGDLGRFAATGLPVIGDTIPGFAGPLAGVLAGLDWCVQHAPDATTLLSVPVDGPFVPRDLAARLEQARGHDAIRPACAASGAHRHGVYCLWPVALRHDLRHALQAEDLRKVGAWLSRHDAAVAHWPATPLDPFFNINTPEQLARARDLVARCPEA
jgi:molybdopterin-guanine dinucleotide biosynthesis protein A